MTRDEFDEISESLGAAISAGAFWGVHATHIDALLRELKPHIYERECKRCGNKKMMIKCDGPSRWCRWDVCSNCGSKLCRDDEFCPLCGHLVVWMQGMITHCPDCWREIEVTLQ